MDRDSTVLLRTVAAAFGGENRTGGGGGWPCGMQVFSRRQRTLCHKRPALAAVLEGTVHLATTHCQRVFRFSPWNCLLPKQIVHTNTVYRETAFLHALLVACLADRIADACNSGKLKHCRCIPAARRLQQDNEHNGNYVFHRGARVPCSAYSTRFVRRFLHIHQSASNQITRIHRDNALIGLKEYLRNLQRFCFNKMDDCFTQESRDCNKRVCWLRPGKFTDVVEKLKEHYHRAHQKSINNDLMRHQQEEDGLEYLSNMQFIQDSEDYCDETHGLICENDDSCMRSCCGRGYRLHTIQKMHPCRCQWDKKSENYNLVCRSCVSEIPVYKCN
ncbi:protein Wnt-4-like [Nilaparvata lugens]|uniref:protein Wnt-4-like n=1 Tax=Nilaparvata lugens TaxID=108931 RepID=UPI00193D90DA|nr:protein Wnt-4-like [Nilaparvata lugens]